MVPLSRHSCAARNRAGADPEAGMRPGLIVGAAITSLVLTAACHRAEPGEISPNPRTAAQDAAREAIARENALGALPLAEHSIAIPPFKVSLADTALDALGYGLADLLVT